MKAYMLGLYSDDDQGNEIVFAKTAKEAKKYNRDLDPDSYIDLFAKRAPEFDGMENMSIKELMKEQWREGWWFHQDGCPSNDESDDEVFYKWYDETFN